MKRLLLRLGSPAAQAVLQQEPFSRLPSPAPPAPLPPPTHVEVDCSQLQTSDAQDACAARELAAAKAGYQAALGTCRTAVASPLRDAFDGSEQAWQQELPAQCDAAAFEHDQPRLQAFARSQCVASDVSGADARDAPCSPRVPDTGLSAVRRAAGGRPGLLRAGTFPESSL